MRLLPLLFAFLMLQQLSFCQSDSVVFSKDLKLTDGIYMTYFDFRSNSGITKEQLVSTINKEQLDFVGKIIDQQKFSYKSNNGILSAESNTVWGFVQNGTLYINFKEDFYRVPVFGSICYLVANVTAMNAGFYDPMFGSGSTTNRTKEVREFLINFYDGIVIEFTLQKVEELLSRDKSLYAEYMNLSRRKQRDQIYRYLRKYNESHPVYFLK